MSRDTAITFFRMLRYAERIWPDMKTNFRSEYFYGFDVALTPVEVFLALLTASLPMIYCPSKNLFRYLKAVYVSRSFRPGSVLGGSGHTASRYPSAPRDDISSKGHVQRAGAGLLSAPRRVKAGLYQLGTINQDDPSSSTERVIAASNSAETKRPRSAASDDESGSWRQDRLT